MKKLSVEKLEKKIQELKSQKRELDNELNEMVLKGKGIPTDQKDQIREIESNIYTLCNERAARVTLDLGGE